MSSLYNIFGYSRNRTPVLVVECIGGNEESLEDAARLRRNLLAHDLIPGAPYFLLAFGMRLFLWLEGAPAGQLPDFSASARSVLQNYLRKDADGVNRDILDLLVVSWLDELAIAIRQPDPNSAADRMLLESGLYEKIRFGRVRLEDWS